MRRTIYLSLLFQAVFIFFIGCKSQKSGSKSVKKIVKTTAIKTMPDLIGRYKNNKTDFSTFSVGMGVDYNFENNSGSMHFDLRIKKDSIIWLSAPLGIFKIMITPDRISFYNRLNKTFADTDFSLLNKWTGVGTDFYFIQNLLMGRICLDQDDAFVSYQKVEDFILLKLANTSMLEGSVSLDESTLNLNSQSYFRKSVKDTLKTHYSYRDISTSQYPNKVSIDAIKDSNAYKITLNYSHIKVDESIRFPYKIPEGYQKISMR